MQPTFGVPNAVNINIVQPQAFASGQCATNPYNCGNYYPLYQTNQNPSLPLYPMNYNNMINYPNAVSPNMAQGTSAQNQVPNMNSYQAPVLGQDDGQNAKKDTNSSMNAYGQTNLLEKTPAEDKTTTNQEQKAGDKKDKEKPNYPFNR